MAEYPAKHPPGLRPVHPGELLRDDVLPALRLTVKEAADQLGISRQMLHRVLKGTASITPEMALRIGKFCGNGPTLWINMQTAYDLWHAERALKAELKKIPTKRAERPNVAQSCGFDAPCKR
jgi:addiction module HigA family antidote